MCEMSEISGLPAHLSKPRGFLPQRLAGWLGGALSLALLGLTIFLAAPTLAQLRFADVVAAVRETPASALLKALLFTALSYIALIGYDLLALKQIRARPAIRVVALASFASSAFSFTLGFPLLTGAAVRYWVYSRAGLAARQVADVTLIASMTFWLGMASALGGGLFFGSMSLAAVDHLPWMLNFAAGAALICALAGYCAWAPGGRRGLWLFGRAIELPGPRTKILQILLGLLDICCAAAALYALTPHETQSIPFTAFAAIYVFAAIVGAVSHAPGGVGVFEAVVFGAVASSSHEALFAALLLFRAIYYIIPFVLALILLGVHGGAGRWSNLFDAFRRNLLRNGAGPSRRGF